MHAQIHNTQSIDSLSLLRAYFRNSEAPFELSNTHLDARHRCCWDIIRERLLFWSWCRLRACDMKEADPPGALIDGAGQINWRPSFTTLSKFDQTILAQGVLQASNSTNCGRKQILDWARALSNANNTASLCQLSCLAPCVSTFEPHFFSLSEKRELPLKMCARAVWAADAHYNARARNEIRRSSACRSDINSHHVPLA